MVRCALKYIAVKENGFSEERAFITLLFLSKNKTSMGKYIKNVCIELLGFNIRACPFLNSFLPNRPFALLKIVLAIITSSAKTVPLLLLIILINLYYFGGALPIG